MWGKVKEIEVILATPPPRPLPGLKGRNLPCAQAPLSSHGRCHHMYRPPQVHSQALGRAGCGGSRVDPARPGLMQAIVKTARAPTAKPRGEIPLDRRLKMPSRWAPAPPITSARRASTRNPTAGRHSHVPSQGTRVQPRLEPEGRRLNA